MTRAAGKVPSTGPKDMTLPITGVWFAPRTNQTAERAVRWAPGGHSHAGQGRPLLQQAARTLLVRGHGPSRTRPRRGDKDQEQGECGALR